MSAIDALRAAQQPAAAQPEAPKAKKYILPSKCQLVTPTGRRIECIDGILLADTPELEAMAQQMLAVGNCYNWVEGEPVHALLQPSLLVPVG